MWGHPPLETDTNSPSRVTRVLGRTVLERGLPQAIRCDKKRNHAMISDILQAPI